MSSRKSAKGADVPESILARSKELIKLAARMGGDEVKQRLTSFVSDHASDKLEQAKMLVESLSRLKGAAMKIGQLLSMDFAEHFPPEIRTVLEKLQSSSTHCLSHKEISEILQAELGPFYARISDLSESPIAAASIGQVHTAMFEGQKIILKIQYPGIANCIESDVNMLRTLARALMAVSRKQVNLDPVFCELKKVFISETNYLNELESLKKYKNNFANYDCYRVPVPVEALCSSKVIAMSFEDGVLLKDWIKSNKGLSERTKLGLKILDLYSIEFFEHGFVQSDPNPSNFLVNSKNQIVLLDLGAVKSFDSDFVREYVTLMKCSKEKDKSASLVQALKMGFVDDREGVEAKDAFYEMMRSSLCAFDRENQPFDFTNKDYFAATKVASQQFGKLTQYSPPPYEIIFLHRKLVGVFGLLKDLKLKLDLTSYWERALHLSDRPRINA